MPMSDTCASKNIGALGLSKLIYVADDTQRLLVYTRLQNVLNIGILGLLDHVNLFMLLTVCIGYLSIQGFKRYWTLAIHINAICIYKYCTYVYDDHRLHCINFLCQNVIVLCDAYVHSPSMIVLLCSMKMPVKVSVVTISHVYIFQAL